MKRILSALALSVTLPLFAIEAPPLGNFRGLAFSSATSRQPLQILSGDFTACQASDDDSSSLRCDVQNGSVAVSGGAENSLNIKFEKVTYFPGRGESQNRHYYFKGTSELLVGEKRLTIPVSVTLTVESKAQDRTFGVIELPNEYAQATVEAFRN